MGLAVYAKERVEVKVVLSVVDAVLEMIQSSKKKQKTITEASEHSHKHSEKKKQL